MHTQPTIPYRQGQFNRTGGWLPADPRIHIEWTRKLIVELKERRRFRRVLRADDRAVSIQDLDRVVKSSARLRMLAAAMLDEIPNKEPYLTDPIGTATIRDYDELLDAFDLIVKTKAPQWSMSEFKGGLIGFPFNVILDWPMATPSGYAFFLDPQINEKLKAILNAWREDVLSTGKSLYVITTESNGWLSEEALKAIEDGTNIPGQNLKFTELFKCDPVNDPEHWGFTSWDDFFVRRFKDIDALRPVQFPTDTKWIVSSCESKPFSRQMNVKEYDSFWLKGQPYSVAEMLNYEHQYVSKFVGGTVYQAFLSATSYHRWNSPVRGEVVYATVVDGTYFSEPTITGFSNPDGPDVAAPDLAQGYICHVATRAIFVIDTKDPIVGFVAAVYVGMADVSTCEIGEKFQGDLPVAVEKGEEIGMFHHGGSTHCLLFEKKVKLAWVDEATPETATRNIPIRSALAYAYASV
ncbi:Phophatidylserine decarboxylase-domain-containing protein [Xylaria cf. heliscus]|nr:Phophatidylserine decarboxylase-domain-containing protein [Xylaria cf. heliscus]